MNYWQLRPFTSLPPSHPKFPTPQPSSILSPVRATFPHQTCVWSRATSSILSQLHCSAYSALHHSSALAPISVSPGGGQCTVQYNCHRRLQGVLPRARPQPSGLCPPQPQLSPLHCIVHCTRTTLKHSACSAEVQVFRGAGCWEERWGADISIHCKVTTFCSNFDHSNADHFNIKSRLHCWHLFSYTLSYSPFDHPDSLKE